MPNLLIRREGRTFGPYTYEDVTSFLGGGELQATDLAWTEGLLDWTPLQSLLARWPAGGQAPHTEVEPVFTQLTWWDTLPDGVKGFSWGALLAAPIWSIGNRVWLGLWSWLPGLGILVAIWLGFTGRELAWRKGAWSSVAQFDRVQRRWALISGLVLALGVGLVVLAAVLKGGGLQMAGQPSPQQPGQQRPLETAPPQGQPVAPQQPAPAQGTQPERPPAQEADEPVSRARLEEAVSGKTEEEVLAMLGQPAARHTEKGVTVLLYRRITLNPQTGQPDAVSAVALYQGRVVSVQYRELEQ